MTKPNALREMALVLLEETFQNRDKGGNFYLDRSTGWFPTLEPLTAEDASFCLTPGGSTIAGHTFHTTFYLNLFLNEAKGTPSGKVNWADSWVVKAVDARAWDDLRAKLRAVYLEMNDLLQGTEAWSQDEADAALAGVTHSAYHLGAVRQFLTVLRGPSI